MRNDDAAGEGRGFTLLEVLVALVIFALAFGVFAQIVQTGLRQSASADAISAATLLARSQLARVGVELPLEVGDTAGEAEDGLRWHTEIRLAEPPPEQSDLAAYLVRVTVAWSESRREREVTLTTLQVGPPPP
ncbi:MAG: type IV pilus modification PilV family protein [Geminicoccaceae bacterium]